MDKKVKYGLAYLVAPLLGIIFLFAMSDNDEDDKFQLKQSIFWGIAVIVLTVIISIVSIFLGSVPVLGWLLGKLPYLLSVLQLVLAVMYFTGKTFELPLIGDLAKK